LPMHTFYVLWKYSSEASAYSFDQIDITREQVRTRHLVALATAWETSFSFDQIFPAIL